MLQKMNPFQEASKALSELYYKASKSFLSHPLLKMFVSIGVGIAALIWMAMWPEQAVVIGLAFVCVLWVVNLMHNQKPFKQAVHTIVAFHLLYMMFMGLWLLWFVALLAFGYVEHKQKTCNR